MKSEAARALDLTDRKSLLALQGVGWESEAESVRFHGRGVTKVGPEVKHGREGWGPLNKGCERRTRALPGVSGGGGIIVRSPVGNREAGGGSSGVG